MMIVFGGNSYVNKDSKNVKCHTTKLHVYDLGELLLLICMYNKVGNQVEVPYRGCQVPDCPKCFVNDIVALLKKI